MGLSKRQCSISVYRAFFDDSNVAMAYFLICLSVYSLTSFRFSSEKFNGWLQSALSSLPSIVSLRGGNPFLNLLIFFASCGWVLTECFDVMLSFEFFLSSGLSVDWLACNLIGSGFYSAHCTSVDMSSSMSSIDICISTSWSKSCCCGTWENPV